MNRPADIEKGFRKLFMLRKQIKGLPLRDHYCVPISWINDPQVVMTDVEADAAMDDLVKQLHEQDITPVDDDGENERRVSFTLAGLTYSFYHFKDKPLSPESAPVPEKLGIRSSEPFPRVDEPSGETSGPYPALSPDALKGAPDAAEAPVPDEEDTEHDRDDEDQDPPDDEPEEEPKPRRASEIIAAVKGIVGVAGFVAGALFVLTAVLLRPVGRLVVPPHTGRHVGAAT